MGSCWARKLPLPQNAIRIMIYVRFLLTALSLTLLPDDSYIPGHRWLIVIQIDHIMIRIDGQFPAVEISIPWIIGRIPRIMDPGSPPVEDPDLRLRIKFQSLDNPEIIESVPVG